jgi:hypothetical protein
MKVHVPVSSAFPAALAAASISLSLVLLPGGGASVRSSGVAPALKLLAGEVVAAVEKPPPAVKRTQPKHVAAAPAPTTAVAGTPRSAPTHSSPSPTRSVPAHRPAHRAARPQAVTSKPTLTPTPASTAPAPQPTSSLTKHGNGKALGYAKKITAQAATPSATQQTAPANGGQGHAYGRPADLQPGPPAVPPGQQGDSQSPDEHADSNGRGGGK